MSSIYNANGTLPQATQQLLPQDIAPFIAGSTNATPIVMHVVGHGYSTGDTVFIEGHLVNTHANGRWVITVVDADHFSLNGSVGNGVGLQTGSSFDYSVNPLITLPSDGDPIDATHLNPQVEGVFNNVPFLYERCGHFRLLNIYENHFVAATPITFFNTQTVPMGAAWTNIVGMTGLLPFLVPPPSLQPTDMLEISLTTSVDVAAGAGLIAFGIAYQLNGGSYVTILQSSQTTFGFGATSFEGGIHLRGMLTGIAAPNSLTDFSMQIYGQAGSSTVLSQFGSWQLVAKHYRRNS